MDILFRSGALLLALLWGMRLAAQETSNSGDLAGSAVPTTSALITKPSAPKTLTLVQGPLPRQLLLAFVDAQTQERHGVLLAEWADTVFQEGVFKVEWVQRPRVDSWASANRLESVMEMLTEVQTRKPVAVMLWGAVGWAATGTFNPDGHGARVAWTDVPFASDFKNWTDKVDFGVTYNLSWAKNLPGDGKWDQVFNIPASIRAKRSVGRVDFSNMKSSSEASNVDEDVEMEDYLRRNLSYRRGQTGFANEVVFVSSLLGATTKDWVKSTVIGRKVTDLGSTAAGQMNPAAGKRYFGMYTSVDSYLREGFRDANGTLTQTLWTVLYKSYGGDPWNVGATARQYLRQSLVVTWGGRHWMPNGETVHEAYMRHSYPGLGSLTAEDTLLGDVTLRMR